MAGKHRSTTRQVGRKQQISRIPHHRHGRGHEGSSRACSRAISRSPDFRKGAAKQKARHETWVAKKRQEKENQNLIPSPIADLLLDQDADFGNWFVTCDRIEQTQGRVDSIVEAYLLRTLMPLDRKRLWTDSGYGNWFGTADLIEPMQRRMDSIIDIETSRRWTLRFERERLWIDDIRPSFCRWIANDDANSDYESASDEFSPTWIEFELDSAPLALDVVN